MDKIGDKTISTLKFLWLQNQTFYRDLQEKALKDIPYSSQYKLWADIGCSTGLITRVASKLNYNVVGYDINNFSLIVARVLSLRYKNISYQNIDFNSLTQKFDVVSATSLLSVVEDKKETLEKLISLLKDEKSTLIIIEPTQKLSPQNVWKLIYDIKSFWYYKGLLLWAKARENKHIDNSIFKDIDSVRITEKYYLDNMVSVKYIKMGIHSI